MKNLQIHIDVSSETYLKDPNASELGRMIVSNSIELIDELGFETFTFKKLGNKIGSPESSIYRYFESKHMLLIYLTYWYWSLIEYKLVFAITNLKSPEEKLEKSLKVLIEPIEEDALYSHVNEIILDRVVMNEGLKTYYIKEVDEENAKGYFKTYKRVVQRISEIVSEINPNFKYPHMLISTIIEGAHQQKYYAEHLPALTDVQQGQDTILKFYSQLVFKVIAK
ncbi:MAG: TetR/AcrR family transcriptional regulator [Flavobacteriaceae bacterium]|nr:TetR/AcrR family transcriptional regulator [Flavobacteriaceae bacterium]